MIVTADRMEGNLFYTAVSRGREFVRVLTSDLLALRESVTAPSDRLSATVLAKQAAYQKRREAIRNPSRWQRLTRHARRKTKSWGRLMAKLAGRGPKTVVVAFDHGRPLERVLER